MPMYHQNFQMWFASLEEQVKEKSKGKWGKEDFPDWDYEKIYKSGMSFWDAARIILQLLEHPQLGNEKEPPTPEKK